MMITSDITNQVLEGCVRLQQMLEIAYCVSDAHMHEIDLHIDHLRRIYELVLSSQVIFKFK